MREPTEETYSDFLELKKQIYSDQYYKEVDLAETEIRVRYNREIDARINQVTFNQLTYSAMEGNYMENIFYLVAAPIEVLQSVENGVLLSFNDSYMKNHIVFLETDKTYFDGYMFRDYIIVLYNGVFRYDSLTGVRTVPQFFEVTLENQYYFLFP